MTPRARSIVLGLVLAATVCEGAAAPESGKPLANQPRRQHYLFAHRLLPDVFFHYYEPFYSRLAADPAAELAGLWDHVGLGLPAPDRLPPTGLREVTRFRRGKREIVIIALPEPEALAEALYVILISGENERIYLTYERTVSFVATQSLAVLCGWTADGKHRNYGLRSSPDPRGLEEVLGKFLTRKPPVEPKPGPQDARKVQPKR